MFWLERNGKTIRKQKAKSVGTHGLLCFHRTKEYSEPLGGLDPLHPFSNLLIYSINMECLLWARTSEGSKIWHSPGLHVCWQKTQTLIKPSHSLICSWDGDCGEVCSTKGDCTENMWSQKGRHNRVLQGNDARLGFHCHAFVSVSSAFLSIF